MHFMEVLKNKTFGMLAFFLFVAATSFSQNYEAQSFEVQNQMDLNKINGVSTWNDISTSFNVYTEGLNSAGEETVLQRAKMIAEIFSINISENGKVIIVCNGGTQFDLVKPIFSNMVTSISKIVDSTYIQTKRSK